MNWVSSLMLFAVFMAAVGALPTEDERRSMTGGEFTYAWVYRFLQNVCINVKAVNPSLGPLSQRVESISKTTTLQETPPNK